MPWIHPLGRSHQRENCWLGSRGQNPSPVSPCELQGVLARVVTTSVGVSVLVRGAAGCDPLLHLLGRPLADSTNGVYLVGRSSDCRLPSHTNWGDPWVDLL